MTISLFTLLQELRTNNAHAFPCSQVYQQSHCPRLKDQQRSRGSLRVKGLWYRKNIKVVAFSFSVFFDRTHISTASRYSSFSKKQLQSAMATYTTTVTAWAFQIACPVVEKTGSLPILPKQFPGITSDFSSKDLLYLIIIQGILLYVIPIVPILRAIFRAMEPFFLGLLLMLGIFALCLAINVFGIICLLYGAVSFVLEIGTSVSNFFKRGIRQLHFQCKQDDSQPSTTDMKIDILQSILEELQSPRYHDASQISMPASPPRYPSWIPFPADPDYNTTVARRPGVATHTPIVSLTLPPTRIAPQERIVDRGAQPRFRYFLRPVPMNSFGSAIRRTRELIGTSDEAVNEVRRRRERWEREV